MGTTTEEASLLAAARGGDGPAFQALVAPYVPALQVHCYRMLASYHDAEEATQETLLRAWRGLDGFEGRSPLLHWLYRIATNTCLKARQVRDRRPVTVADVSYLEPYPDSLLDQLPAGGDPAAAAESRESVALAYVAALQLLPATQRAVLILREVLAWRADEVAELLDTSVAGVNSALQRARATLRTAPRADRPLSTREREAVRMFTAAWERADIPALAALLREDAALYMPPELAAVHGRAAIAEFFATVPNGGRLDQMPVRVIRANGQPAVAAYLPDPDGSFRAFGIVVLTVIDGAIATLTGFPIPKLFDAFGLPPTSLPVGGTADDL
ncbi:MAG TPA: RNA polymerase subunit sigma-70 [Micromonosporaceae bacterium]|nr:RNA polymerase subunit sigma-70 [Micromonosporaceae bacterium]